MYITVSIGVNQEKGLLWNLSAWKWIDIPLNCFLSPTQGCFRDNRQAGWQPGLDRFCISYNPPLDPHTGHEPRVTAHCHGHTVCPDHAAWTEVPHLYTNVDKDNNQT